MGEPELTKSEKLSLAGKKGYKAALASTPDFHQKGAEATQALDLHFCGCHGVGLAGAIAHGKTKGKKHRYAKH